MKISDWTVEIHRVCRIESTEPTEVYSFFRDIENGSGEDLNSLGSPEACWKEYKRQPGEMTPGCAVEGNSLTYRMRALSL